MYDQDEGELLAVSTNTDGVKPQTEFIYTHTPGNGLL